MEFPRLVFKSASEHLLVEDEAEYKAALKDGWYGSVPEALAPKAPEAPKKTKKELEAEEKAKAEAEKLAEEELKAKEARLKLVEDAVALGLEVKETDSDEEIKALIDAKLAK